MLLYERLNIYYMAYSYKLSKVLIIFFCICVCVCQ